MEGPWWSSWLATFGVQNFLDKAARTYGLERGHIWWIFHESNRSLRARLDRAIRGR